MRVIQVEIYGIRELEGTALETALKITRKHIFENEWWILSVEGFQDQLKEAEFEGDIYFDDYKVGFENLRYLGSSLSGEKQIECEVQRLAKEFHEQLQRDRDYLSCDEHLKAYAEVQELEFFCTGELLEQSILLKTT